MGLFSIKHIIFLVVIVGLAISLAIMFAKKYSWSKKVLLYSGFAISFSEVVRVFVCMREYDGKYYLPAGALPFHLCALQIFLIFFLYFAKSQRLQRILMAFMYPTMLCGAAIALLMPADSGIINFDNALAFQFMFSHGILLFVAIYMYLTKPIKFDMRTYGIAISGLFIGLILAIYLNTLAGGAQNDVNFFYISYPPLEGLPILNLNQGWYMYIVKLALLAFVLVTCSYIPVMIKWFRLRKFKELNVNTNEYEHNYNNV
jgi:hypothetical integral membrane protein (TIGR02206 family)